MPFRTYDAGSVPDLVSDSDVLAGKVDGFYTEGQGYGAFNAISATGQHSLALGYNALATGLESLAIGANCAATARKATAIGPEAMANEESTVSVGTTYQQRRIVNVADPTSDTDAATKGYVDGIVGSHREVFSASPEIVSTEMLVGTDGWMPGDGGELSGYSSLMYDGKRVYSDGIIQFTDSFHYTVEANSPIVVKVIFNYPDEIIPDNSINYPIHLFEDDGAYIGTAYFRHTSGELELYIAAICAWGLYEDAQFNVILG